MKPTKRSHGYEFGGPVGVFFLMIALPAMVLGSALFCNSKSCSVREKPIIPPFWGFKGAFFDVGHLIVDGWIIFQAIIYMLPFGKVVQGRVLENGSALDYRINGFLALTLCVTGFAACLYFKVDVTLVYDCFIGITTATLCWSVVVAILVYAMACMQKTGLSPRGNTGNIIYDFFMGHQLNPRWGKFDFKLFFEIRAGLIGWVMINFCMAAKEHEKYGEVSTSMILVCVFQFLYVADCLFFESSFLSTMDIIEEGFGFMLAFGDISFVPVLFSLHARFLVDHPVKLSWITATVITSLFVIGYAIFRGSNSQKDRFRADPLSEEFRDAETILTSSGKRLLVSGWWGLVRHPNYLGDIIMGFAWTFPCGFSHAIPFFYPVHLVTVLVHRELRDERNNHFKYGKSWDEYCRRVPYRILPKIF
ncbi:delta(14)-sterol reductase LBR-like isoform X1 [Montipora capricornis]|uniref:delta(14)-sterol reductase LBR-like isoform X1 n=1 Tax=Montipora capricornis TaxID=246305 RepID=UPI0035F11CE2